jgi:hypothetical protein
LQRSAGNAAVCRLLHGGSPGNSARVQGSREHALDLSPHRSLVDGARSGTTKALPEEYRGVVTLLAGQRGSGVRIHDDPVAWALNGSFDTAAFTVGHDVFFRRGAYAPNTPTGGALIGHELGHVSEGHPGAHAAAIDTARVDVQAERDYAEAATTLEAKLGPHLSAMPETSEAADDMLGRLRQIVDAWAEATRVGKTKAYGEEFAFPTGTKYYGSFLLTAKEVKKVFEKPGQPLRKKLNLVYYATRNGNLAKYLEVAANELRIAHAAGKTEADQRVNVKSDTQKGEVSVGEGFAKKSGLEAQWAANKPVLAGGKTSKQEVEADLAERVAKAGTGTPTLGGFGAASGMGKSNKELRGDKRYDTYRGLNLEDTSTLTRADVGDITTAEMRLLYERTGARQPWWISSRDKAKYKAKGAKRVMWEQGGQNIEVAADSETRRIAETTQARLEGGISGSTDLMMHAAKHLGFTTAPELKKLRLALVAWMLSNRDHSFFEIMKVAADYGVPFNVDANVRGSEYEHQDNFDPLTQMQVNNFSTLMPNGRMPSYYAAGVHKGNVDLALPSKGTTSDTFVDQLRLDGLTLDDSWKGDPKSKDLAQWLAVKARVATLGLQAANTEDALKANRIKVQALQKDQAWQHVAKTAVDPNSAANLRALLSHQFGAAAVVSDGDLVAAGVPAGLLAGVEEYKRYDVMRLLRAVEASAPKLRRSSEAHAEAVAKLSESPPYSAVRHWLGSATAHLILLAMLAKYLGAVNSSTREKAALADAPLLITFKTTYADIPAQRAQLVSLGLPRSVADEVQKMKEGIDSSTRTSTVIFFRLEQLQQAVAAANYRAAEAPTSPANQAARRTVAASPAYRAVRSLTDTNLTEACVAAFVTKLHGAKATTAAEDAAAFKRFDTAGQRDVLTAAGIPRDLLESNRRLIAPMEQLRRAAVDAGFDTGKAASHVKNTQAWTVLTTGAAFAALVPLLDATPVKGTAKAKAFAAAMVKSQVGAAVLPADAAMLALATEQRMANDDKVRLGKTSAIDTTTLRTPKMQGEAHDPAQTDARRERYWATAAAKTDLEINIGAAGGARSPTIMAQLTLWTTQLKNGGTLATEIDSLCTHLMGKEIPVATDLPAFRGRFFQDGDSVDDKIQTFLAIVPADYALQHIDPQVRAAVQAIEALSPRERGAIYQYTNKLHDQLGYATQNFSMATDFTPADLANTTAKLQAVPFMLPILQALNSALQRLPAYAASDVYSGRKSGAPASLVTKTDQDRRAHAARYFPVGSVISYSYPLSSAKDVPASFLSKGPTYDVALLIKQPLKTGRDIEYLSNKAGEKEVLFAQGSRFEITATDPQPPVGITANANTSNKVWVTVKEV